MFCTERYDDALDQIAHYRHYPSMKPFIGRQFGAE